MSPDAMFRQCASCASTTSTHNAKDIRMATRSTTTDKGSMDAIDLLIADHKTVQQLFKKFESLKEGDDNDAKGALVTEICTQLMVHAQIEEEIFYPAVREAVNDQDLMDEAEV